MNPANYDAWYDTPRGRWIGETEFHLASRLLSAKPGARLLDVGCGTGWFTRRFAQQGLHVTGLDSNPEWLAYARACSDPTIRWVEGDAQALPFPDAHFDHVLSIAALCFADDEQKAVAEIVRVARCSFVIGWLNRSSLLYRDKGKNGGRGAYHGARWHTAREVLSMFSDIPACLLTIRSAIFLPSGTRRASLLEQCLPNTLKLGGLLLLCGEKGRVSERALVRRPGARQVSDRGVAKGIQRGTAEKIAGRSDAVGLRQTTGPQIGYINHRTLKPSATENRGDIDSSERFRPQT